MTGPGELIRRRRHLVTIIVRSTCVILVTVGAVGLLAALARVLLWGNVGAITSDFATVNRLSFSATCIVVGLALAAVQERLVKWLVPVMRPACPNCGYTLRRTSARVCSECGFVLEHEDARRRDPREG